jgi:hypothetical protein
MGIVLFGRCKTHLGCGCEMDVAPLLDFVIVKKVGEFEILVEQP